MFSLQPRVLLSEFLGTMFLLIGVIGSGIMAERLSPSDSGLQLLQNAAATTGVLIAIISIFGTVSADFNPAVTISAWVLGHREKKEVFPVIIFQISGGCICGLPMEFSACTGAQAAACCFCDVPENEVAIR